MKKQKLKFWIAFGILQFVIWIVLILKYPVLLEKVVWAYAVISFYTFAPKKYKKPWIVYFAIALTTFVCLLILGLENLLLSFLCAFTMPGVICIGAAIDEYK